MHSCGHVVMPYALTSWSCMQVIIKKRLRRASYLADRMPVTPSRLSQGSPALAVIKQSLVSPRFAA